MPVFGRGASRKHISDTKGSMVDGSIYIFNQYLFKLIKPVISRHTNLKGFDNTSF